MHITIDIIKKNQQMKQKILSFSLVISNSYLKAVFGYVKNDSQKKFWIV